VKRFSAADTQDAGGWGGAAMCLSAEMYEHPEAAGWGSGIRSASEHNFSNTEQNITLCANSIFGKM